jgi:hypothetical protein
MSQPRFILDRPLSGVITLTIDRPRHNALDLAMVMKMDDMGCAILLKTGKPRSRETKSATVAPDDPTPSCIGGCGHGGWFLAKVKNAGTLTICTEGSNYDSVLAVYTGARGPLTELDWNSDEASGTAMSGLDLSVTPGTYWVMVGANGSSNGGKLNIDATLP